jgi:hypothetical protein
MKKCEDNWKRWGNWRDIKIKERQRNQNQNNVVRITQARELLTNTSYEAKLKQKGKMLLPNTPFNPKLK